MDIRRLEKKDIPAAKKLWTDAFGDSEAFVRFYFENKFTLEGSLGAFDGPMLAGDLTLQDMGVRIRGSLLRTGFLAGCATREDYRNRGVMRELLKVQMEKMNSAGYTLCHLHPFLHSFYRKFGWETVSYMREVTAQLPVPEKPPAENAFSTNDLLRMYESFTARADGSFKRTPREMEIRIGEHVNDGGKVIAADGGYALYFIYGREIEVIELVYPDGSPDDVIAPLGAYKRPVRYLVPDFLDEGAAGSAAEYTMMRVVNARRLLGNIHLPDSSFTIRIRDGFCVWNDEKLAVDCRGGKVRVRTYDGAETDIETGIGELAILAARGGEDMSQTAAGIFPRQKTFFFNTY